MIAAPALAALGSAGAAAPAIGAGLSAGVGAATAGAAAAGGGLFTAANALTALQAGSSILGGIGQFQQQRAAAAQDAINARISATQANQIDAQRREELEASLGGVAAARAANNLGLSTTGRAITSEFRRVLDRDRIIEVGNRRSQASAFRASAAAQRSGAAFSLLTGGLRSGIPILQRFA